MSKESLTCSSCGEDNLPNSEFCMNCGVTLKNAKSKINPNSEDNREDEFIKWKRSVPFTVSAAVFLLFIDLISGNGIDWAYWAVIPILLFAVIAPYFSYKMS